jgi:hypothetical protein
VPRPHVPPQQSSDGRPMIRQRDPATGRYLGADRPPEIDWRKVAELSADQCAAISMERDVWRMATSALDRQCETWRSMTLLTFGLGMVVGVVMGVCG